MKDELMEKMRRKARISEAKLFIFYTLNRFERYETIDRAMGKGQFEGVMVYLLLKYAVSLALVTEQMKTNHTMVTINILNRWHSMTKHERTPQMEKQRADAALLLKYDFRYKKKTTKN